MTPKRPQNDPKTTLTLRVQGVVWGSFWGRFGVVWGSLWFAGVERGYFLLGAGFLKPEETEPSEKKAWEK